MREPTPGVVLVGVPAIDGRRGVGVAMRVRVGAPASAVAQAVDTACSPSTGPVVLTTDNHRIVAPALTQVNDCVPSARTRVHRPRRPFPLVPLPRSIVPSIGRRWWRVLGKTPVRTRLTRSAPGLRILGPYRRNFVGTGGRAPAAQETGTDRTQRPVRSRPTSRHSSAAARRPSNLLLLYQTHRLIDEVA